MDTVEFPRVIHWAIPFFVLAIALEYGWSRRSKALGYGLKDTLCCLALGAGNVLVGMLMAGVYLRVANGVWEYRLWDLGTSIWTLALGIVLDDLRFYWHHRFGHQLRWVWAAHITHHSSQRYNLSTALRQPWTISLTGIAVLTLPMVWLGFHPNLVLFCGSLNLIYQFWVHTEAVDKMPRWFEYVFNTPSHHRVHHGKNPRYLDANYAGIFILWDRLFGTFVPEDPAEPVRYGLVKDLETFNPIVAAFHEWKGMATDALQPGISLAERLAYLFAVPGWSHDGSRMTSAQLQEQARDLAREEATKPSQDEAKVLDLSPSPSPPRKDEPGPLTEADEDQEDQDKTAA